MKFIVVQVLVRVEGNLSRCESDQGLVKLLRNSRSGNVRAVIWL